VMIQKESEESFLKQDIKVKSHLYFLRDTSIIIGLVTLMGYLVAYNYQKGFRDFYNIDDTFINDINLTQVIISIAGILGVSVTLFNLYPLIEKLLTLDKKNKKLLNTRYITKYWVIIPLLIVGLLWNYMEFSSYSLIFIASVYYLLVALPVIISSFFNEGKNYTEKFRNNITIPEQSLKDIAKFNILESTKGFILGLFVAFILLGLFANLIGYSKAAKKDEYYIFNHKNEDYIIISNFNGNLIIAPFDKKKNIIFSSFQIIESKSTLEKPIKFNVIKFKNSPSVEYTSK
jgi:hypothetical protein